MIEPIPAREPLRVMIVDDHPVLVEAIRLSLTLQTDNPIDIVVVDSFDEATVRAHASTSAPDVILVDLDLGNGRCGSDLVASLVKDGFRVVLFTGSTSSRDLGAALAAGASGIVSKSDRFGRLVEAIGDAAQGRSTIRPADREHLIAEFARLSNGDTERDARIASLTAREREVLMRLADGATPQEIAAEAFVSIATVRSQIKAVLRKLAVSSQLAAVAIARTSPR